MRKRSFYLSALTFVFCFLFLQQTYSQENLQPGYVILKSGDTLRGIIDYRNWENNPKSISFRADAFSPDVNYTTNTINCFVVNNEVYVTAVVAAEISETQINELNFLPKIVTRIDTTFLQVIVSGEKSLYYYSDKIGKKHFYIGKPDGFELLIYKKYLKEGKREISISENKTFIGQLSLYMQDCPEVKAIINNTEYNKKSLAKVFNAYYENMAGSAIYVYTNEKLQLNFGALAGVSITKLKLSSSEEDFDFLGNAEYTTSTNFSGGLFLDVILARNQRKWSIYNELILSSYDVTGQWANYYDENYYKMYTNNFAYSYLKVNTMVRFNYPFMTKDLKAFINAGISNGYAISETNSTIKEVKRYGDPEISEGPALQDTRKYEVGFLAGLGVKYRKFSFETRYEGGNGMSTDLGLKSKTERIYVLLGFCF